MKIEKHNSHGMQLVVMLSPEEAESLIIKLMRAMKLTTNTEISHYISVPSQFEDDNDRWVPTDFDVVVEGTSFNQDCKPAFPCGKEIVQGGMNSAPEFCNMQEGHEHGCYRR